MWGMADEADPIIRKTVSLPADMWRQIEDYQFEHRIKKDSVVIRYLLELGLDAAKRSVAKPKGRKP
jgi:hypothetical protein